MYPPLERLRPLAGRLARGRVFKRRLPTEFDRRPLYITPDSALQYIKPGNAGFARGLLNLAQEQVQPGDVIWDVGANVEFSRSQRPPAEHHGSSPSSLIRGLDNSSGVLLDWPKTETTACWS